MLYGNHKYTYEYGLPNLLARISVNACFMSHITFLLEKVSLGGMTGIICYHITISLNTRQHYNKITSDYTHCSVGAIFIKKYIYTFDINKKCRQDGFEDMNLIFICQIKLKRIKWFRCYSKGRTHIDTEDEQYCLTPFVLVFLICSAVSFYSFLMGLAFINCEPIDR